MARGVIENGGFFKGFWNLMELFFFCRSLMSEET